MIWNIKKGAWELRMFFSVYNGYRRRHNRVIREIGVLEELTLEEINDYYNYWKVISSKISLKTVRISKTLSGKYNKYIVPEEFYTLYFEPYFNSDKSVGFLQNKSIYNKWFQGKYFPKDYFHKIDGVYYTESFEVIEDIYYFIDNNMQKIEFPIVIKPSKDSYGGADIYFVKNMDSIKKVINQHSNLVVQEKINQSELINLFNPDSVNTVRVCLYKDVYGKTHVLNTSIRMGKDGSLDNETAGGIVCNIKPTGFLNEYAVDKYGAKYLSHPNSNFIFKNKKFPLYKELKDISKEVVQEIVGARLISLDMALDSNNSWRCIEVNLFGQTIRFAQYAGEPFFGELTDEIRKLVSTNCNEK